MKHGIGYGSERRLRQENQDCFGVFKFPGFTLAVLCDGLGGQAGGAQASTLAVRTIFDEAQNSENLPIPEMLLNAIKRANLEIYEASRADSRLANMGTTTVVAAIAGSVCFLAHVGDSRSYLLRDGKVMQLTRDHTMLNLFVDANLIAPEDASLHPDASVLSRSLGAERDLDIEMSTPITLKPKDTILMCTDGVHQVLEERELTSVDWNRPDRAIELVLARVAAKRGEDNATAVGMTMGTTESTMGPTPLPMLKPYDTSLQDQSLSIEEDSEPQTSSAKDASAPPPTLESPQETGTSAVKQELLAKQRLRQKNIRNTRIRIGALASTLIGLICVMFWQLFGGSTSSPARMHTDAAVSQMIVVQPDLVARTDGAHQLEAPSLQPKKPTTQEPTIKEGPVWFQPDIPIRPPRTAHKATEYLLPPMDGRTTWQVVQASREHRCTEALVSVSKGMDITIDNATLYAQAWECYNDHKRKAIQSEKLQHWTDFERLVPLFQGSIHTANEIAETPSDEKEPTLSIWARPATGGIEYRLDQWESSDETNIFADVISDLIGNEHMADDLGEDLLIEAQAAVALARIAAHSPLEPTAHDRTMEEADQRKDKQVEESNQNVWNPQIVDWWARRVYVSARAMNGRAGALVRTHRADLANTIDDLLKEATALQVLPVVEDGSALAIEGEPKGQIPEAVKLAYLAATTTDSAERQQSLEAPLKKTPPKKRYTPRPQEPELLDPSTPKAIIYRK